MAKELKQNYIRNQSFQVVIKDALRDYKVHKDDNVVSFRYHFVKESDTILSNIICVDVSSKNSDIQTKIDKLNELYNNIIDIENHLIKK